MDLNVVAKLRIMPKDVDVDLEDIRKKLDGIVGKYGKLHSTDIIPIAFGVNSIEVVVLLNDSKGGIDEIEEGIEGLAGVGEATVIDVNRL